MTQFVDADGHRVGPGRVGWARSGLAFPCAVAESGYFVGWWTAGDTSREREIAHAVSKTRRAPPHRKV